MAIQENKRQNKLHVCINCGEKNAPLEYTNTAYCPKCYKRARLMQWGKEHQYPNIHCQRLVSDGMDYAIAAGEDMWQIVVGFADDKMIDTALKAVGLVGIPDDVEITGNDNEVA